MYQAHRGLQHCGLALVASRIQLASQLCHLSVGGQPRRRNRRLPLRLRNLQLSPELGKPRGSGSRGVLLPPYRRRQLLLQLQQLPLRGGGSGGNRRLLLPPRRLQLLQGGHLLLRSGGGFGGGRVPLPPGLLQLAPQLHN